MKGIMRKALSLVMMLAMVATLVVVPNVDAKAASSRTVVFNFTEAVDCDKVLFDIDSQGSCTTSIAITSGDADTSLGWGGRTMYTMTKIDNKTYSVTLSGTLGSSGWVVSQVLFVKNGSVVKGLKFLPHYTNEGKTLFDSGKTLYVPFNTTAADWSEFTTFSDTDPNAATAADVNAVIAAIGKVELSDDCKNKIMAAETAVASYNGAESDLDMATLNAAKTEWDRLIGTGAAGTVTLYVKPSNWESVHLWAWDMDGATVVKESWPGTKLEAMEDNAGWYSCTFEISSAINALFSEKGDDAKKTADWKYLTAGEYWVTIANDNNYETSKEAPTGWKSEEAGDVEVNPTPPTTTPTTPSTTPSTSDKYQQKYTSAQVVGNFADKLTNCNVSGSWDVEGNAGNMEYLGNGVYALVITFDKTTADVEVEYKVAFDHSWDVSIGLQSVETAFTTNNGGNIKVTIPAGSTSFKIIASEKDTVVYDSIQNAAEVAQYEEIAKMADGSLFVLYVVILVAGCAMVAVASKKRFAR